MSEGQTWQDILHLQFKKFGRHIKIANAGVDGQSTIGNIHNFDVWFPKIPNLKAKYVLAYVGVNDTALGHHVYNDKLISETWYLRLHHALKNNSAVYNLLRSIKNAVLARRLKLAHQQMDFDRMEWVEKPLKTRHFERYQTRLADYKNRLRILVGRIQKIGGTPIFVTQPRGDGWRDAGNLKGLNYIFLGGNGVDRLLVLELFNKATLSACKRMNLLCIDLATELQFEKGDFYDLVHTTPKGAKKIGRYLYGKLQHLTF